MPQVEKINLLGKLLKANLDGLIIAAEKVVIYEFVETSQNLWFLDFLEKSIGKESVELLVLDFVGIDIITPSVAEAIVRGVTELSRLHKFPIILVNARDEVLWSLDREANVCDPVKAIWATTEAGEYKFAGSVPRKLDELLELLKSQKKLTAATVVELLEIEPTSKAIGNYSVYLQKLFKLGMVGRTKINANDCELQKRGWTYSYVCSPTIWEDAQLEL